ncbi:MAG TPA: hypothetical protein VGO52_13475 [Hyphomonadaceae bacterium]|jgi:hypothetical protein|nr:hypothetical protein [Hyphomonadaceae bacterium]
MSPTTRNSLPSLWEQAVTLWRDLVLGFGHPHDLMRWGWMRALEHRALGHWLRDLEKLVRRAIRADASELDLPALKTRARRRKPGPPQSSEVMANEDMPRFRRSYSDDCTTWKVSFRMSAAAPGKHRGPRKRSEPSEKRRCRPLAFRIEALRRAINHRADHALRYARRLARIAEANVRALTEALKAYDPSPPATDTALSEATPRNAKHVEPG